MCAVNLDKQDRTPFRLLKARVGPPSTRQIIRFPLSLSVKHHKRRLDRLTGVCLRGKSGGRRDTICQINKKESTRRNEVLSKSLNHITRNPSLIHTRSQSVFAIIPPLYPYSKSEQDSVQWCCELLAWSLRINSSTG